MRNALLIVVAVVFGVMVGVAGTLLAVADATPARGSAEARLIVKAPIGSAKIDAAGGIDAVWHREIATHAARIASHDVLAQVLKHPEVKATSWFAKQANPEEAVTSLEAVLNVQPIPNTALITVAMGGVPEPEAKAITSAVVRVYLDMLNAIAGRDDARRTEVLFFALHKIMRTEEDLRVELEALARVDLEEGGVRKKLMETRMSELAATRAETESQLRELQLHRVDPDRIAVRVVERP